MTTAQAFNRAGREIATSALRYEGGTWPVPSQCVAETIMRQPELAPALHRRALDYVMVAGSGMAAASYVTRRWRAMLMRQSMVARQGLVCTYTTINTALMPFYQPVPVIEAWEAVRRSIHSPRLWLPVTSLAAFLKDHPLANDDEVFDFIEPLLQGRLFGPADPPFEMKMPPSLLRERPKLYLVPSCGSALGPN